MLFSAPSIYFSIHVWLLAVSLLTALLEIQIEGPNGWAAKLPTWRYSPTCPLLQHIQHHYHQMEDLASPCGLFRRFCG